MRIVHTNQDVHAWVMRERKAGKTIAFVPTMGNLHAGHIALVKYGLTLADRVIVSIFVNPLQFGANEDFATYPRTFEADREKLEQAGASLLFFPEENQIYPNGREASTRVMVPGISDILCGAHRPGHFVGVATVVSKLFNITQPDCAIFGEKDYQQVMVIRQMVKDLFIPIKINSLPTVRETDGLAMSSRNGYLSPQERLAAPTIYRVLCHIVDTSIAGNHDFGALERDGTKELESSGFLPEYLTVRDAKTLAVPSADAKSLVVLCAARLGRTRLIDNITFTLP